MGATKGLLTPLLTVLFAEAPGFSPFLRSIANYQVPLTSWLVHTVPAAKAAIGRLVPLGELFPSFHRISILLPLLVQAEAALGACGPEILCHQILYLDPAEKGLDTDPEKLAERHTCLLWWWLHCSGSKTENNRKLRLFIGMGGSIQTFTGTGHHKVDGRKRTRVPRHKAGTLVSAAPSHLVPVHSREAGCSSGIPKGGTHPQAPTCGGMLAGLALHNTQGMGSTGGSCPSKQLLLLNLVGTDIVTSSLAGQFPIEGEISAVEAEYF